MSDNYVRIIENLQTAIYKSHDSVTVKYELLRSAVDLISDLTAENAALKREIEDLEIEVDMQ